jgi:hypothetical protein
MFVAAAVCKRHAAAAVVRMALPEKVAAAVAVMAAQFLFCPLTTPHLLLLLLVLPFGFATLPICVRTTRSCLLLHA